MIKMRVLKVYLVFIAFLAIGVINAKELVLDRATNTSETLSYSYFIVGEDSEEITALTDAKLKTKGFNIVSTTATDSINLVDLACKINRVGVIDIAEDSIEFNSVEDASERLSNYLAKYFFGGNYPKSSVVFESGKDGYVSYRIPSAISLPSGRVVAFIEARAFHKDTAENDIIAKYSDDNGVTWSNPILVRGDGKSSLNNPCAVYIEEENKIILIYQLYPPKTSEADNLAGVEGENIQKVFSVSSVDEGITWSNPVDITSQIKHPQSSSVCSGPGIGIRVAYGKDKGRVIIPFNALNGGEWFNYLGYSDDLGESWGIISGISEYGTNESQVIQSSDNEFKVFARCHRYKDNNQATTPTHWNPWSFSKVTRNRAKIPVTICADSAKWGATQIDTTLIDPLCQGSVIRVSGLGEGECSRVLVSNPASNYTVNPQVRGYGSTPPMRINGTARISYDNGTTWSYSKRIFGNRLTEFGYSVLVDMGAGEVGCIFESAGIIRFATFNIDWLTNGKDKCADL